MKSGILMNVKLFIDILTVVSEGKLQNLRAIQFDEREVGGTTFLEFSACMLFKSILRKP